MSGPPTYDVSSGPSGSKFGEMIKASHISFSNQPKFYNETTNFKDFDKKRAEYNPEMV